MLARRRHIRDDRTHNAHTVYTEHGAQGPTQTQHTAQTQGMMKQDKANGDHVQGGTSRLSRERQHKLWPDGPIQNIKARQM